MKNLLLLSLLLSAPVSAFAQTEATVISSEPNDSVPPLNDRPNVDITSETPNFANPIPLVNEPLYANSISSFALLQPGGFYACIVRASQAPDPLQWGNWQVAGFFDRNAYPGMMDTESATLGLRYSHNRFSVFAGGIVNKYAFYQGLHTQTGVTANVSYMFSPRWSTTLFGTYYFGNGLSMPNGAPMPPSMLGFYNVSRFGGYVDYQISDNFGIQAGAQMVQQVGPRSHYELRPIATPYFKVGKVAIGLPVGEIVYGIIQSQIEKRNQR